MIRFLMVSFLFVALCHAATLPSSVPLYNSSCTALTCEKSGASCSSDFYSTKNFTCALNYLAYKQPTGCCPMGQYCLASGSNSTSTTCMKDNIGSSCSANDTCKANTEGTGYALCFGGKCATVYGAGDSCSTGSDCYVGSCTNGICAGLAENDACVQPPLRLAVCATNLYCGGVTGAMTCKPVLSKGAACTAVVAGGEPCPAGQWCAGQPGVCTDIGSVGSGKPCTSGPSGGSLNIAGTNGYLCSSGLSANTKTGLCVSGKTYTLTSCTNNTDCTSVESDSQCQCAPNGKGYCSFTVNASLPNLVGVSDAVSLINCLAKNNCSYDYTTPQAFSYANNDPNSCSVKNCNSYLKKYKSASCSTQKVGGSCSYLPYCSGFPVWAIIVIVVVAILLVLAVVFVIFLVLRKRRDYSSI